MAKIFFFFRVLGLLICPKIAEAKNQDKTFCFPLHPPMQKKKKKKKKLCRKKMVLYMGRNKDIYRAIFLLSYLSFGQLDSREVFVMIFPQHLFIEALVSCHTESS